jgi:hypothetical protein
VSGLLHQQSLVRQQGTLPPNPETPIHYLHCSKKTAPQLRVTSDHGCVLLPPREVV